MPPVCWIFQIVLIIINENRILTRGEDGFVFETFETEFPRAVVDSEEKIMILNVHYLSNFKLFPAHDAVSH